LAPVDSKSAKSNVCTTLVPLARKIQPSVQQPKPQVEGRLEGKSILNKFLLPLINSWYQQGDRQLWYRAQDTTGDNQANAKRFALFFSYSRQMASTATTNERL